MRARSEVRRGAGGLRGLGLALLVLLAPPTAGQVAGPDAPQRMLRLHGGDVLFGRIESHVPEEIRFRRLDNDGLVHLPWSFLDPEEARSLRLAFGYVDTERGELMMSGTQLVLQNGTELVGYLDPERATDRTLWLKRVTGGVAIPRNSLKSVQSVRIPALDVYTKEELYLQRAQELAAELVLPGTEGAQAHATLARRCERLFDFSHAAEHYRTAIALDPTYEAAAMAEGLKRAERKAELEDQVELLAEVDLARARKRYDRALELLESFPATYPDSPLMEDWSAVRRSVLRSQQRDLEDEVVARMHSTVVKLARDAARQREGYEQALAYLEEGMEGDLLREVTAGLQSLSPGIESDEVLRLWAERRGGRRQQASYGLGTWMLGEDRARATYEERDEGDDGAEPARGSQAAARKRLEERIKRYLKNQELSRRARSATSEEDDPKVYWKRWDHGGRYNWMLAYFVEFSGLFRIEGVRFSNCRECAGTGAREVLHVGGGSRERGGLPSLAPCPVCRRVGVVRRIRYR